LRFVVMSRINRGIYKPGDLRKTLPTVLTSFIGREREIAEVKRLLGSSRLVTLTGAAGSGKTRLALRVVLEVNSRYTNGVHWVELGRVSDPALVPQTVAKVLHVAEQHDRSSLERLLKEIHGRQLLLALDNCEHLLHACAQFVEALLIETDVFILATSREPLGVKGEWIYPVPPLSLPPDDLSAVDVDSIEQFEAIQLFVERARAILPAFELTAENASTVARICQSLDGIPLAIELASARVTVLTTEQIATRLDNLFELLPPATHLSYSHHHTLHAAIEWSHNLLSINEQVLLRRLSVFPGGCSLATAESVCAGEGIEPSQMLELLSSLVNKSLVLAETLRRGAARYSLLETIRQYAQEKLLTSGEGSTMRDRHLGYFLQLAEGTEPKLRGKYQQMWLDWLEGEYENIRAALSWSLESGQIESGLRIAIALYAFWMIRDYVEEGLAWIEQLLSQSGEGISKRIRANALAYATFLAGFRGNSATQKAYGHEAGILAEAASDTDKPALAWALTAQAYGARAEGDFQTEFNLGIQAVHLFRELGDMYPLSVALSTYSFTAMSLGKYDIARAFLDEGLPLVRKAGNPYRIAMALNFSGDLARCEGNYVQAKTAYEESVTLLRELNAVRDLASALHNLGHACLHLGEVERAHALFGESIALQQAQGNTPGVAECLIGFAALAIVWELPAAAARLLASAVGIGGQRIATAWPATRLEYEHYLARARAGLTEPAFQAEQAKGRIFSLEQSVAYAKEVALRGVAAREARKKLEELTAREREVATLIAHGKSNGEIAVELVVSKRTVETHVSNILSKLGATNRAKIVRWGIETGLVKANDTDRS
jgi:predicted ATPase/DNA-binding CsgD family transcriptional regulator